MTPAIIYYRLDPSYLIAKGGRGFDAMKVLSICFGVRFGPPPQKKNPLCFTILTSVVQSDPKNNIIKISPLSPIRNWGREFKGPQNQFFTCIFIVCYYKKKFLQEMFRTKFFTRKVLLLLFFYYNVLSLAPEC